MSLGCRYRCVLKVPLPSWPHCNDYLTVWRRVPTCVFRLPLDDSGSDAAAAGATADDAGGTGPPGGGGSASGHASVRVLAGGIETQKEKAKKSDAKVSGAHLRRCGGCSCSCHGCALLVGNPCWHAQGDMPAGIVDLCSFLVCIRRMLSQRCFRSCASLCLLL